MRIARLCLLMGVIAALASTGAVSAQTVLKPVPEQSSRLDNPSTVAKVKTWTHTVASRSKAVGARQCQILWMQRQVAGADHKSKIFAAWSAGVFISMHERRQIGARGKLRVK